MSDPTVDPYLAKAERSLRGAESECAAGRYENCANRAYYAAFQAAIAALRRDSIRPAGDKWGHDFVESRFVGQLINRRHRYPPSLRGALADLREVRQRADYRADPTARVDARRSLRGASDLVDAVRAEGDIHR